MVHLLEPSRTQLQRLRAYYAANVSMIDKQVGQIMETLEAQGYLENSIVIFTSDHGDCLGDHGQIQKWTMYDIITRVPAIFWAPERFPAGRRVSELCQWMDIGPTVLELAGLRPAQEMQAVSLLPALRGEDWRGREYIFAEHPADGNYEGPYQTMIRSERYKLVHFAGQDYGLLFDLEADPGEVDNRWDDDALAEVKRGLLAALLNWRLESTIADAGSVSGLSVDATTCSTSLTTLFENYMEGLEQALRKRRQSRQEIADNERGDAQNDYERPSPIVQFAFYARQNDFDLSHVARVILLRHFVAQF